MDNLDLDIAQAASNHDTVVLPQEEKQLESELGTDDTNKEAAQETPEKAESSDSTAETDLGIFQEFADLRQELIADGVDMDILDTKFQADELTDEDLAPIASKKGVEVKDVRAFIKTAKANLDFQAKLAEQDAKETAVAIEEAKTQLNEVAGGSYQDLLAFVGKHGTYAQVLNWQSQLNQGDLDVKKSTLAEMQSFRQKLTPSNDKPANLGLLTQSSTKATVPPVKKEEAPEVVANPLEGNPYRNYDVNKLCAIKVNGNLNAAAKAQLNAVMQVKCPELA